MFSNGTSDWQLNTAGKASGYASLVMVRILDLASAATTFFWANETPKRTSVAIVDLPMGRTFFQDPLLALRKNVYY